MSPFQVLSLPAAAVGRMSTFLNRNSGDVKVQYLLARLICTVENMFEDVGVRMHDIAPWLFDKPAEGAEDAEPELNDELKAAEAESYYRYASKHQQGPIKFDEDDLAAMESGSG